MIKKVLGLLIIGFSFIGFSNSQFYYGNSTVGSSTSSDYDSAYNIEIGVDYEFVTTYLGSLKRVFAMNSNIMYWWSIDGRLNYSLDDWSSYGNVASYFVCDYMDGNFNGSFTNCVGHQYSTDIDVINNMLTKIKNTDRYFYGHDDSQSGRGLSFQGVNISEIGKSVVFPVQICWSYCTINNFDGINFSSLHDDNSSIFSYKNIGNGRYILGLENIINNKINFSNITNDLIGVSPAFGNNNDINDIEIGSGGFALNSTGSAINYFEKYYGRDKNICYAGVDNLTDLFGSNGVSFQKGTGLNLFQVYSGIYGNPELDRVYVWLNSQLINYNQWFNRESPLFLSEYNSGTNQVDIYYDNLTFPFSGKPVAYYFLADNIFDYSNPTEGSEIVSYCNLKINNGTFEEIIDQATKNNINNYTEQSNKNNGLNPDGTIKVFIDYSQFGVYTGDAWVSSGIDIDFTVDNTLKSSIRSFFERIDVLFGDTIVTENNIRKGSRSVGSILPSYIVFGLLFVVLFKFLRKR